MNKTGPCNASCIRFVLVKLLRRSGYDAAVCTTRWQGAGKVPGGIPSKNLIDFTSKDGEFSVEITNKKIKKLNWECVGVV